MLHQLCDTIGTPGYVRYSAGNRETQAQSTTPFYENLNLSLIRQIYPTDTDPTWWQLHSVLKVISRSIVVPPATALIVQCTWPMATGSG